jgi:hypothetical protein
MDLAPVERAGPLPVWRIHRKIGMSGGLFANLLRESGFDNTPERLHRLRVRHAEAYKALFASVQPLPGAGELLQYLSGAFRVYEGSPRPARPHR